MGRVGLGPGGTLKESVAFLSNDPPPHDSIVGEKLVGLIDQTPLRAARKDRGSLHITPNLWVRRSLPQPLELRGRVQTPSP